jgi:hypothetical protein
MFNKKVQKVFVIGDRKYTFAELKYNMEVHLMVDFQATGYLTKKKKNNMEVNVHEIPS